MCVYIISEPEGVFSIHLQWKWCVRVFWNVYVYPPSTLRQKADVGNVLKDSLVDNQPAISEVCGSGAAGLWRIALLNLSRRQVAAFLLVERSTHTNEFTLFWSISP